MYFFRTICSRSTILIVMVQTFEKKDARKQYQQQYRPYLDEERLAI